MTEYEKSALRVLNNHLDRIEDCLAWLESVNGQIPEGQSFEVWLDNARTPLTHAKKRIETLLGVEA